MGDQISSSSLCREWSSPLKTMWGRSWTTTVRVKTTRAEQVIGVGCDRRRGTRRAEDAAPTIHGVVDLSLLVNFQYFIAHRLNDDLQGFRTQMPLPSTAVNSDMKLMKLTCPLGARYVRVCIQFQSRVYSTTCSPPHSTNVRPPFPCVVSRYSGPFSCAGLYTQLPSCIMH